MCGSRSVFTKLLNTHLDPNTLGTVFTYYFIFLSFLFQMFSSHCFPRINL